MAVGNTAVWRVRPSGSDNNGAGYDSISYPGGTDYSQQDAAQATGTVGTASGTTTFTDAGGLFTSAMVGNALRIRSGTGFTVGYYFITAFTNSTTVTLDRSPGTGTVAVWNLGGGCATVYRVLNSANAVGDKIVAGNSVFILGSSLTPSVADYSFTGLISVVAGDTTSGKITIAGDQNTRPFLLRTDGDIIFNALAAVILDTLYFKGSNASNGRILDASGGASNVVMKNCVLNLNDLACDGIRIGGLGLVFNCEIFSKASPTSRTGFAAINAGGLNNIVINNYLHDLGGGGILVLISSSVALVYGNIFSKCTFPGIITNITTFSTFTAIVNNTFDSGLDDAIKIVAALPINGFIIYNNIFSNQNQTSKFAIDAAAGSAVTNDKFKMLVDFNDFFNNTSNYNNMSAGPNDLALDPQYTGAPNFNIGTNLKAKAFPPSTFLNDTSQSYIDMGAVQRQESSGGSTTIVVNTVRNITKKAS